MKTQRVRRLGIIAVLFVAVLGLAACTPEQEEIYDAINQSRAEAGLPALLPHVSAMNKAQAWAEVLAAEGGLRHSYLPDGMTGDWRSIGENVGLGPDIAVVHQAFLNSPAHRANIMNPDFNFVGTGHAVAADGTVFVVQVFARY